MAYMSEKELEMISLEWFREIEYSFVHGPDIAPAGKSHGREDFRQVIFIEPLRSALKKVNPEVPPVTIESAVLQLTNPNIPGLLSSNRQFHQWMTTGLPITYIERDQEIGIRLKIIDFEDPASNDWLIVNQLEVVGSKRTRIPDVVVYINGLPIAVIELKNLINKKADIWAAFNQIQNYKNNIPDLFTLQTSSNKNVSVKC